MSDYGYEMEAIEDERRAADMEMAQFEAEGARFWSKVEKMRELRAAGDFAAAAAMCPHGGGYPLDSPAAKNEADPFAGEEGVRCSDCGSRLSAFDWDGGVVTVPCELSGGAA